MWSLGVLLYIMLSGRHPFERPTAPEQMPATAEGGGDGSAVVMSNILAANYSFDPAQWSGISGRGACGRFAGHAHACQGVRCMLGRPMHPMHAVARRRPREAWALLLRSERARPCEHMRVCPPWLAVLTCFCSLGAVLGCTV